MATKNQLIKKHQQVLKAESRVESLLEELSILATNIYGEELKADLCPFGEIEFRTTDNPEGLDDIALRLEDIIKRSNL